MDEANRAWRADLNEATMRDCLRLVSALGYGRNAGSSTLRRLLGMLRRVGATPPAKAGPLSQLEQLIGAYERFLLEERNLVPQTVAHRRLTTSRFLSEKFGGGPLNISQPACARRHDVCVAART
jgi:hypothetical protein